MASGIKILLIRFSSIGDIVLTSPIIRCIDKQTDFEIHALTKHQNKEIFSNNPRVSKVYSFKDSTNEILKNLISEGYDYVIDLQKNLRSVKLRKKLAVKSYSFPKVNIDKWIIVNFGINTLPKLHVVDRYFKAAEPLGIKNDNKGLEYYIPADDEIIPESIDINLKEGFVAFVIGGQHTTKILPAEKVADIISKLKLPAVLIGGSDDYNRGEDIIKLLPNMGVLNLCGKFNLNQSASLIKSSSIVMTNDTGLMHIAAAFEKPVVSFWGNTIPEFGMYPYLPSNDNLSFIAEIKNLRCRPCSKIGHKKCPKKHFKCMKNQDVASIIEATNRLIIQEK
ncbi:MAG: glycosyltransferase family 9 protein [Bacteroidetes bacterium]|jgi:ADP-heptose:LPS heptosyltransferase|nr:glycosyltransferase family 9 protein [Bacteroidota bacterium]